MEEDRKRARVSGADAEGAAKAAEATVVAAAAAAPSSSSSSSSSSPSAPPEGVLLQHGRIVKRARVPADAGAAAAASADIAPAAAPSPLEAAAAAAAAAATSAPAPASPASSFSFPPLSAEARRDATVFIASPPAGADEALLFELFSQFGTVVRVALAPSFAHVEFAAPAGAAYACRAAAGLRLLGAPLSVARAGARQARDAARGHVMVRGLHAAVDEAALEDVFGCCAPGLLDANVVRDAAGASKGYGFAVFATLAQARTAVAVVAAPPGLSLCGRPVAAALARKSLEIEAAAAAGAGAGAGEEEAATQQQRLFTLRRRPTPVPAGSAAELALLSAAEGAAGAAPELLVGPDLLLGLRREAAAAACARVEQGLVRMMEVEHHAAALAAGRRAAAERERERDERY